MRRIRFDLQGDKIFILRKKLRVGKDGKHNSALFRNENDLQMKYLRLFKIFQN
jgi:hypothetical protein